MERYTPSHVGRLPPQVRSIARQGTPLHPWIEPRESRWYKSGKSLFFESDLYQVIPTPSRLLDRISPIFPPFFPVFCVFSPSRRGGANEPKTGIQGQETVSRAPKHRFAGLANSGCSERMAAGPETDDPQALMDFAKDTIVLATLSAE